MSFELPTAFEPEGWVGANSKLVSVDDTQWMLCKEGRSDRADDHAPLHVLGNRQAEQVAQGRSNVRWIGRWQSVPWINSFSEKNEEAVGRSFRRGVPRFATAEEPLHSLERPGRREAKRRDHRNQSLTIGGTEQFAELPVNKLHYQLEE